MMIIIIEKGIISFKTIKIITEIIDVVQQYFWPEVGHVILAEFLDLMGTADRSSIMLPQITVQICFFQPGLKGLS